LHNEINESHGQPTATNTLAEINILNKENNLVCQIKDFATNQLIPKNKKKIIKDGISPVPTEWICKKSPHVGAQIYDIQLGTLQEFNVLNGTIDRIVNQQERFNFIANQTARILLKICAVYPICSEAKYNEAIEFSIKCFYEHLKRTGDFGCYNYIISGAFAHRFFGNSGRFHKQVEFIKSQSKLPAYVIKP
jgi:hypothetical protein